jgi:hypothetical protein
MTWTSVTGRPCASTTLPLTLTVAAPAGAAQAARIASPIDTRNRPPHAL